MSDSMKRRVFAHRGARTLAPENTLAAFIAAADHGARWIELDVDVISDGTIIVIHDTRLDRTTNRRGGYYNLAQSDLTSIDAGSWFSHEFTAEPLPTLAQALDVLALRGVSVNIEMKSCEAGAKACDALIDGVISQAHDFLSRSKALEVVISSFNPLLLARLKARAAHLRVACLFERWTLGDDWRSIVEMVGAEAVNPGDDGLSRGRVEEIAAAGYDVNVWTVNDAARANELFNWGVTGIFTDKIHELGRFEAA